MHALTAPCIIGTANSYLHGKAAHFARGWRSPLAVPAMLHPSPEPADHRLESGPNSGFHFQLLLQFGNGGLGFFNGAAQPAEQ